MSRHLLGTLAPYPRVGPGIHPLPDFEGYRSTALRHPKQPLVIIPQTLSELSGPVYPHPDALHHRLYFDDEAANESDPILALVPAERRHTLIAQRVEPGTYRFDIRLQGNDETVFFEA